MKQLLNMYFSFNGRLNRLRYFIYGIPLSFIFLFLYLYIVSQAKSTYTAVVIFIIITLVCSISGASLSVRRLHDLDMTGWWVLINLLSSIPILKIISGIFGLYVIFAPGTKGENQYGDDLL